MRGKDEIIRRIAQRVDAPLKRLFLLDLRLHENEARPAGGKRLLRHRDHIIRRVRIAALCRQRRRAAGEEGAAEEGEGGPDPQRFPLLYHRGPLSEYP